MPIYEYKCHACGAVFDRIQKFSDEPLTIHDGCGGAVERLISAPAFHLKGSGWYVTDYAKGKAGANDKKPSESTAASTSDSKTDSATEAKPAATESKPAATTTTSSDSK